MPKLSNYTEERRETLSRLVAEEAYRAGLLWVDSQGTWYARISQDADWEAGYGAASARDWVVTKALLARRHEEPYASWPELRSCFGPGGRYELIRRMRWLIQEEDWARPEDLPES